MTRLYWFSSLALLAAILLVEYDLSHRISARQKNEAMKALVSVTPPSSEETHSETLATESTSFFDSAALKEAQKVSRQNNNPKILEQKMNQLARGLSGLEIRKLAVAVRNKDETEERRVMAIELLSRSKTPDALQMLRDFVVVRQANEGPSEQHTHELESSLKAQAIEGIATYPKKELALSYLNSLANQVDDRFLQDRIARSEEGIRGPASASKAQPRKDETALKSLLQ